MKKFVKTLIVMLTFVTSMFFVTGCFGGGGVSGKTYEVVHAEVKGNSFSAEELETMNWRMEGEVGKTLIFAENGDFGEESTLKSIQGMQSLKTWSQNGDTIVINGGNNLYPTKAYIDGEQVIIEVGNITGMLFVYTLEEVAE